MIDNKIIDIDVSIDKIKDGIGKYKYKENILLLEITQHYWKGGFATKKEAQDHEDLKKTELSIYGKPLKDCKKTLNKYMMNSLRLQKPSTSTTQSTTPKKCYIIGVGRMQ